MLLVIKRAIGLEPTTSSLGSWHSTTELRPHVRKHDRPSDNRILYYNEIAHLCLDPRQPNDVNAASGDDGVCRSTSVEWWLERDRHR